MFIFLIINISVINLITKILKKSKYVKKTK